MDDGERPAVEFLDATVPFVGAARSRQLISVGIEGRRATLFARLAIDDRLRAPR